LLNEKWSVLELKTVNNVFSHQAASTCRRA
jgi:hypothetical protein